MHNSRRLVGAVFLVDCLTLALFFGAAVWGYSANDVVPRLSFRWEIAGALLNFFHWLPALQFLAVAVALGTTEGESAPLIASSIFPAALLSAILAAGAVAAVPPLQASRSEALRASALFNTSLAEARLALEGKDLAKAEAALASARAVSPEDRRLEDLTTILDAAQANAANAAPGPAISSTAPPLPTDASGARAYYLKALALAEKGQDFEANWYANAAARIDPTYVDAKRLAATTWERLAARSADVADKERAAFYDRKLEGYGLLLSKDPIGAYRVFTELAAQHGSDPDVRRYLAESLDEVKHAAFFKDEVDDAFAGAVLGPVFLRLPSPNKGIRFLAARDAAWSEGALYFREVEYLETSDPVSGGGLLSQASARFGKLAQGKLFMTCVDRKRPSLNYLPKWKIGPANGITSVVDLPLAPETAYRVVASRVAPEALSLPAAWKAASEAQAYGVDPRPLISELLARSSAPFAVFTAAALGIFAGVRFRPRKGKLRRGYYVLVPLMAAALVPALVLAERVDRLISAWSERVLPGLGALGAAAGVRALVLFLAVLLMAGARNDRSVRRS